MSRQPQEEVSAGGVVYRFDQGEILVLLIQDGYRNWGFPKGHVEDGEEPSAAAVREIAEETGVTSLSNRGSLGSIEWSFRLRGSTVHKTCAFFLFHTDESATSPQETEGITACVWVSLDDADRLVSYANARDVLRRARDILVETGRAAL